MRVVAVGQRLPQQPGLLLRSVTMGAPVPACPGSGALATRSGPDRALLPLCLLIWLDFLGNSAIASQERPVFHSSGLACPCQRAHKGAEEGLDA